MIRAGARPALVALLAGLVLALTACGTAVVGIPAAAAGSTAQPDPTVAPSATPAPAKQPAQAPVRTAPDRVDLLKSALLRPTEIGPNWSVAPDQPTPDASAPAVCGGQGVVGQFPDAQRIGTALSSDAGERMQQTLSLFADDDTAGKAFDAFAAGLDCDSGTLGTAKVTLTPADDVQSQVHGDRASAWTITSSSFAAVLVSVQSGNRLVNFVFLTPKGGKLTRLDALALVRTGVARLLAT